MTMISSWLLVACRPVPLTEAAPTITSSLMPTSLSAATAPAQTTASSSSVVPTIAASPASLPQALTTQPGQVFPALLYIAEGLLIERHANGTDEVIASLPDEGAVSDAIRVEDSVFVLRQRGLQRVGLADGVGEVVVRFDEPILFGELLYSAVGHTILYSLAPDSGCTAIGVHAGFYELDTRIARTFFSREEGYLHLLGTTRDNLSVYAVPFGCDPEFPEVWRISLATGEILATLPTWDSTNREYGDQYAALSPNGRYLAFASSRSEALGDPVQYTLRHGLGVYNLEPQAWSIQRLDLPNSPSHASGLLFSPDGGSLYFLLQPEAADEEPGFSHGLWRLDVRAGAFSRVAAVEDPLAHLLTMTDDGRYVVLQSENSRNVTVVDMSTGAGTTIEIPGRLVTLVRDR